MVSVNAQLVSKLLTNYDVNHVFLFFFEVNSLQIDTYDNIHFKGCLWEVSPSRPLPAVVKDLNQKRSYLVQSPLLPSLCQR